MLNYDVLIVEDEAVTQEYIRFLLLKAGARVVGTAVSGEQAVAIAREKKPDVILMDILLQGEMDGIEAAKEVLRTDDIAVVFLSAHTGIDITMRATEISPFGYVTKPFKERDLQLAIQIAIYRHQAERKLKDDALQMEEMNRRLEDGNRRLVESQSMIIQQEKLASIGQLSAGVAHELNNPIGFISSNMSTLQKYLRVMKEYIVLLEAAVAGGESLEASDQLRRAADDMRKSRKIAYIIADTEDLLNESLDGTKRITTIVRNLRDFSRVDFDDHFAAYDLREGVESTLIVARNEVKYVADVETQLEAIPMVSCVSGEINQVLLNIIVNAAQAIRDQHRSDRGKILIRTWAEEGCVHCRVSDDGPGIKPEHVGKIYDPFFTTKEVGKGTGLGLSISYNIVVGKHGGRLEVDSRLGSGTAFTISLPVKPPSGRDGGG